MKKILMVFSLICFLFPIASYADKKDDRITLLLETVGLMSAQGIYLTYVAIGSSADGFSKNAYDDKTVISLLTEYIRVSEVASKQLNTLLKEKGVEGEDVQFVNELIATYVLLIKEAEAFKEFVLKKDEKQMKNYDLYRKQAWEKISVLLGIEK